MARIYPPRVATVFNFLAHLQLFVNSVFLFQTQKKMLPLLFVLMCYPATHYAQSISIAPLLKLGDTEETAFFRISDIEVSSENNIYVADSGDNSISKFDMKGNLLARAGRDGEGPGEFSNGPTELAILGHEIISLDMALDKNAPVFDLDLNYKHTLRLLGFEAVGGRTKDILYITNNDLSPKSLEDIENFESSKYLWLYDQQGTLIDGVDMVDLPYYTLYRSCRLLITPDDNLVLVYKYVNRIDYLDSNGKLLRRTKLPGLPDEMPGNAREFPGMKDMAPAMLKVTKQSMYLPEGMLFRTAVVDNRGHVFIQFPGLDKAPNKTGEQIIVLDYKTGREITRFTLPQGHSLAHIDHNNHLYTRENQASTIGMYEIIYQGF